MAMKLKFDWHPKYWQVWGEEIGVPGPPLVVCKGDLVTVEVGLNQKMGSGPSPQKETMISGYPLLFTELSFPTLALALAEGCTHKRGFVLF